MIIFKIEISVLTAASRKDFGLSTKLSGQTICQRVVDEVLYSIKA